MGLVISEMIADAVQLTSATVSENGADHWTPAAESSKRGWRVLVTINPGNSLAYWVFGRR